LFLITGATRCVFILRKKMTEMQTKPPKVQIAGAGIAGLTTGLALQKIGIEVEIAPHAAQLGGAFGCRR
jgi:monoamine oxidase